MDYERLKTTFQILQGTTIGGAIKRLFYAIGKIANVPTADVWMNKGRDCYKKSFSGRWRNNVFTRLFISCGLSSDIMKSHHYNLFRGNQ